MCSVSCVSPDESLTDSPVAESEFDDSVSTPEQETLEDNTPLAGDTTSQNQTPVAESSPVAAATASSSPVPLKKRDCEELEMQQEMNQCAQDNYVIANDSLNKLYKYILQGLDEGGQQQLADAEEQWSTFRDAQCAFESDYVEGGSIAPLIKASCLEQVTDNRVAELRQSVKATTSFESADAQLNQVYQAVKAVAEDTQDEALTDVQLSWLDYRDAHCEYEANLPSGLDLKTCLTIITETRVQQLQTLRENWSL